MPLVSVIVPVYNVENYLRQCLDSIINQTLKDIEIICVDDGSTDKSLDILKEYKEKDDRITILQQQNQYAGVARNNGLKIAKGEYLSFLDSDDFFKPEMLEEMYNKAKEDNSDVVVCEYLRYDNISQTVEEHIKINEKFITASPFSFKDMPNKLCGICHPNPWTKLFKKELFVKNKLKFDNTICFNDFTCVMTALAISDKIAVINKPFIYYRTNQSSNLTGSISKKDPFSINLQIMKSLYNNLNRLNVYDIYKYWFENKIQKTFIDNHDEQSENKAKTVLPEELFNLIYRKNTENPLVSIILPIFNTKKEYLNECINSLLKQTYDNLEILFIDDCSTTETYDYIENLSPKIKLIRNKVNLGCSKNAKKGFNLAKGKYIVKVDSDDYIDPTLIEKEVKILEENPDVGAVCCELKRFGKKTYVIKRPLIWSLKYAITKDLGNLCGYAGGMMFRSNLLSEIDIDTQFRVCEDFDFHLQILEKTKIQSIHEILYYYRAHESNIMISARGGERVDTMKKILNKHIRIYNEINKTRLTVQNKPKKKNKYF